MQIRPGDIAACRKQFSPTAVVSRRVEDGAAKAGCRPSTHSINRRWPQSSLKRYSRRHSQKDQEVLLSPRIKVALIMILPACLLTMPVQAQEPRTTVREVATLAGSVERVDRFSRALTLRLGDGVTQTVYVAPDLKLFDELKTGDKVTVRVVESVIVAVRPDLKPNVVADTTADAKKSGAAARGEVLQQLKAVVTIESVDLRTQMVTYKTSDNRRVVRAVADAHLLEGLKPGDVIEITYTRERAIELERRR
jgi:Cu/Ag efflux protein CusF